MWEALIPLGLNLLQNIGTGGKSERNEQFDETKLSPELEAMAKQIMEKAAGVFSRPFPNYTGQRVAQPTAARQQLSRFMPQIQGSVTNAMNTGQKYTGRIDKMMGMAPSRISVPTLTGNSVQSTTQGGYYGGTPGGNAWAGFDPNEFVAKALPTGKFDMSRVAYDPKVS